MASKEKYLAALGMSKHAECYACGGMVDADGKAFGGEVPDESSHKSLDQFTNAVNEALEPGEDEETLPDMDEDDEDTHKAKFVSAIMKRGK